MQYLVRSIRARRRDPLHHFTGDPADLKVSFRRRSRRTGERIPGLGPIVEDAGEDRTQLELRFIRQEGAERTSFRTALGGAAKTMIGYVHVSKVGDHVRILPEEDEQAIAALDQEVADLQAQIKAVRVRREALVEGAWRRAKPVYTSELVAKAEAAGK